jgi:co-chaperonin GroES (HSP10)
MKKTTEFTACPGYVVVEPLDTSEQSNSPFIISNKADVYESTRIGKVVSVGHIMSFDDRGYPEEGEAAPCEEGDVIVHKQWHSENFEYHGKHYQFVSFKDVAAVLNERN